MKTFKLIALVFTFLPIASCGSSGGGGSDATTEDGWIAFEANNYADALQAFLDVLAGNSSSAEAHAGAGWAYLKLLDYANANTQFDAATSNTDANAGSAFARWAIGDNSGAITKADAVLTASPNYAFPHDTNATATDLHLIKAHANYQLGNYAACLASIKMIDTGYSPTIASSDSAQVLLTKLTLLGPVS